MKKILAFCALIMIIGCQNDTDNHQISQSKTIETEQESEPSKDPVEAHRLDIYAPFDLTAKMGHLSDSQKTMVTILIEASQIMDDLFWQQAFGDREALLNSISDPKDREFAVINYGPWDRLANDQPFISGYQEKPLGAMFYPADMTKQEYQQWREDNSQLLADQSHLELYSMVSRNEQGELQLIPYNEAFKKELEQAAELLRKAAEYSENEAFANYLMLRADALLNNEYQPSDLAWMDMKDNPIELVFGPIETYEDRLFGYRTAFESYVLIKDLEWSKKLAKFAQLLPQLQKGLPVAEEYKQEMPGTDADLNAYDVIYYSGHSNAGSKTIAINLPNDEEVQLAKGTRRLQLKNAMRAKFDKILLPIADQLIAPEQRKNVTFDAFFANTMFHEVAHGLGIKNTINESGLVRTALKETASPLEEGKADILGLYMVSKLYELGEIEQGSVMDNYVTFLAGIFRSVRFGASSAHGQANMMRFNYFQEAGAFSFNEESGHYSVNFEKMTDAIASLSNLLLTLQGDGDYNSAKRLLTEKGKISDSLQKDLDKLTAANIPVDIKFNQGIEILGLK